MPSKRNAGSASHSSLAVTPSSSGKTTTSNIISPQTPTSKPTPAVPKSTKSARSSKASSQSPSDILNTILSNYAAETPQRVKIIDAFMGFLMALGAIQFVYVVLAGNYPFNAFLSGFSATVGQFVLTVSLRMQTNPENKKGNFEGISDERAFADFVFGSLILHLFCINFIN